MPVEAADGLLELICTRRPEALLVREFPRDLSEGRITLYGYGGRPLDTVMIAREATPDRGGGRWILENGDDVLRFFAAETTIPLTAEAFGLEGE